MEEFKGTKGEWSFEEDFDKKYDQPTLKINSTSGIEGICTIWSGGDEIYDCTLADARLIVASKELLEALQKVNDFIIKNKGVNYMVELLRREVPNLNETINRALNG